MFGVSAPRMAVRAAIPWYWRWLGLAVLGLAILLLARATFDFGKRFAGFEQSEADHEMRRLADGNAKLQQEFAVARGQLAQTERQLQMEQSTHANLIKQMKQLAAENAALKEDLAFFQTLMPSGGKEGGVALNRFLVQNDESPGEFRYRMLLTQTGRRSKDFEGTFQLVINLQQNGRKVVMTLPAPDDKEGQGFRLSFRFYQRIEGAFRVARDAVVKSVQVRVYDDESSEPRLSQTVNVS